MRAETRLLERQENERSWLVLLGYISISIAQSGVLVSHGTRATDMNTCGSKSKRHKAVVIASVRPSEMKLAPSQRRVQQ